MGRFDNSFKQPYELVTTRVSMTRGVCSIIYDRNREEYLVGKGITVENAHEGGPYGCRTVFDKDDAYSELIEMVE